MTQSILVTGGAGNIGSALTRALVRLPQTQVVVADNLSTGSRDKVHVDAGNLSVIKADVNDFDDISSLFYRFHFTHVFHFAAVVGVQRTLANPLLVLRDITGIENVLRLCKNTGVERVYFASSSEVYGEPFARSSRFMAWPIGTTGCPPSCCSPSGELRRCATGCCGGSSANFPARPIGCAWIGRMTIIPSIVTKCVAFWPSTSQKSSI